VWLLRLQRLLLRTGTNHRLPILLLRLLRLLLMVMVVLLAVVWRERDVPGL
jgi:hypothetical protein